MSSADKNLSFVEGAEVPNAAPFTFGIVVSEWNHKITGALCEGAVNTLIKYGAEKKNILIKAVPGSFELCLGAQYFAEFTDVDAILCLGCVIQGETRHFDFICQAVAKGITDLNLKYNLPVVFGVLTTDNMIQAMDRAGGKHGNKGNEAAITAIKMLGLRNSFQVSESL